MSIQTQLDFIVLSSLSQIFQVFTSLSSIEGDFYNRLGFLDKSTRLDYEFVGRYN